MMFRAEQLFKAIFLLSVIIIILFCNKPLCAQNSSQFGAWRMTDYIEPEIIVQTGHPHPVTALSFSNNGMLLASRGQHLAKIWDLRTGKELRAFVAKGEGESIAISPDSQYLATTTDDGVKLWNIKTGNLVKTLSWASVIKFSPDGKILAIGENGGNITPWGKISFFDLQLKKYIFESDRSYAVARDMVR